VLGIASVVVALSMIAAVECDDEKKREVVMMWLFVLRREWAAAR